MPKSARNGIFIWNTNAWKLYVSMLIIAWLYDDKPEQKLTFQVIGEDLCDIEYRKKTPFGIFLI